MCTIFALVVSMLGLGAISAYMHVKGADGSGWGAATFILFIILLTKVI